MRYFYDFENYEFLTEIRLRNEFEDLKKSGDTEAETFEQYVSNCNWRNDGNLEEISERIYNGRFAKDEINNWILRNTDLDVYVDIDLETSTNYYCLRCEDETYCEIELYNVLKMISDYLNAVGIDTDSDTSVEVWESLIKAYRVKKGLFDF